MKKMIMLLGAIVFASALHAATMTWSILNMQAANVEAGWAVALYDAGTTFDYAKAADGTLKSLYSTTTIASGTTIKATESGLNNPSGAAFAPGDSISMYAVIFQGSSIESATAYLVSDVKTGSVNAQGSNFTIAFGSMAATTSANTFKNAMAQGWQPAGTPEPTSGLLLLLGGAMLALRRKRA